MSNAPLIGLDDSPEVVVNTLDVALAKRITEVLMKHYPGHPWAVYVDGEHGMAHIKNMGLSGNWGFMLHINFLEPDPNSLDRKVMRAGGELLERYNITRGAVRMKEYLDRA
jgi:hypothetical protein